jgi:hypothetical protein
MIPAIGFAHKVRIRLRFDVVCVHLKSRLWPKMIALGRPADLVTHVGERAELTSSQGSSAPRAELVAPGFS